jgi:hypothetical protein
VSRKLLFQGQPANSIVCEGAVRHPSRLDKIAEDDRLAPLGVLRGFLRVTMISDIEWFAKHPDERQYIRVTTPAERAQHQRRFAVVTKDEAGGLTFEYGEL